MNLGSNLGSWESSLISPSHDFVLFETISGIYESIKQWPTRSRSLALTQFFLDSMPSYHPPRARLFRHFFESRELAIMKPSITLSHMNSKSHGFPYLALLGTFPQLSSVPSQALLGRPTAFFNGISLPLLLKSLEEWIIRWLRVF